MTSAELSLPVLLFAPLAAALIILLGKFLPRRWVTLPAFLLWLGASVWALAAAAPAVFSGRLLTYSLGGWSAPWGITLELRGIAWIATCTDVLIGAAAWLQSLRSRRLSLHFYFFFFLALFALQGTLYTGDLFNLFIWFEVLSLSSFVLIAYERHLTARLAAIRYLLISSVSIIMFLLGVWILYHHSGVLSMAGTAAALPPSGSGDAGSAVGLALALITGGVLTRAAIFPFHTWLPEAHAAAPYPVSALLSGFVIKAPVLALWRFYDHLSFPALGQLLVWTGAASALLAVIAAMAQRDAKKLLGYHSVSQMGYILAAFGVGGIAGKTAALYFIIAHALFKSLLFLTVGEVTDKAGSRNVYRLHGLGRRFPLTGLLYAVAACSIAGVPLFAGYSAKLLVAEALPASGAYYLLLATGVGTAASFFKLSRIFTGPPLRLNPAEPERPAASTGPHAVPHASPRRRFTGAVVPLGTLLLAAGCLLMGLFPGRSEELFTLLTGHAAGRAVAGTPEIVASWFSLSSLLKAFITLAAGFLLSLGLFTSAGKAASTCIRRLRLDVGGALRLLTAGFAVLLLYGAVFY
jgi:multicomponent Na+:H+ antiporter subunit D